jgi:hypothetical protein
LNAKTIDAQVFLLQKLNTCSVSWIAGSRQREHHGPHRHHRRGRHHALQDDRARLGSDRRQLGCVRDRLRPVIEVAQTARGERDSGLAAGLEDADEAAQEHTRSGDGDEGRSDLGDRRGREDRATQREADHPAPVSPSPLRGTDVRDADLGRHRGGIP